jgi:uncharacterized protein (TIGR02246 family)
MVSDQQISDFAIFGGELYEPFLALSRLERSDAVAPEEEARIRDLLNEYCYCYDAGQIDRVVALFTPDAVISNASGIHRGTAAIRRNYEDFVTKRRFGFHFVTNVMIRVAPAAREAVATSYLLTLNVSNADRAAFTTGTYVDRLVRQEDVWRIAERRITADIRTTTDQD